MVTSVRSASLEAVRLEKDAHLEIGRNFLESVPRHRNRLDIRMTLLFKADDRLIKHHALVIFRCHLHQTLHKVLQRERGINTSPARCIKARHISSTHITYLDLLPAIVISLERAEMMLHRNDVTVAFDEFLMIR